jgi:hypothetical protein
VGVKRKLLPETKEREKGGRKRERMEKEEKEANVKKGGIKVNEPDVITVFDDGDDGDVEFVEAGNKQLEELAYLSSEEDDDIHVTSHKVIKDKLCPITPEPFVDAVKNACGHVYEKSAIWALIKRNTELGKDSTKCPVAGCGLMIRDKLKKVVANRRGIPRSPDLPIRFPESPDPIPRSKLQPRVLKLGLQCSLPQHLCLSRLHRICQVARKRNQPLCIFFQPP